MGIIKRRNYLINRDFQFKFIAYTLIPSIFCLGIFYISLSIYFSKLIKHGLAINLPPEHPYYSLINDQHTMMNSLFIFCVIFSVVFYIGWGIIISHKIAGPLFRLTNFFKNANGQKIEQKLSFRPGDFFLEIPRAINEWIERTQKY